MTRKETPPPQDTRDTPDVAPAASQEVSAPRLHDHLLKRMAGEFVLTPEGFKKKE